MPKNHTSEFVKSIDFNLYYNQITENIKMQMFLNKITQSQVGKYLGITQEGVSQKINSKTKFTLEEIFKLSLLFKCSIEEMLKNRDV